MRTTKLACSSRLQTEQSRIHSQLESSPIVVVVNARCIVPCTPVHCLVVGLLLEISLHLDECFGGLVVEQISVTINPLVSVT